MKENVNRKLELYNKYCKDFNIKPSLEVANAFYVGYGEGYADSAESNNNHREEITANDWEAYGKDKGLV